MMTYRAWFVILATAACPRSQETQPIQVRLLCRINDGLGALLEFADGSKGEFHIEVSATRARLVDRRMPGEQGVSELPVGSDGEARVLEALASWIDATFSPEAQKEMLALERLPDPRTQEEDHASQRVELLRTVRRYAEVTRPQISKVFAGRDTVTLSLQLQLGTRPPQQVLWRRLGNEAFTRMHLDTNIEPVRIASATEQRLLLGIENWLAARIGKRAALWQAEPPDLAEDVRLVLHAYRGYREATSPRIVGGGTIMDAGNSGSRHFEISDSRQDVTVVRFDYAADSQTRGRLREGHGVLVEVGSARETELLALLQRAATLRRTALGTAADADWHVQTLATAQVVAAAKRLLFFGRRRTKTQHSCRETRSIPSRSGLSLPSASH